MAFTQRSEATRTAILEAARRLLASKGYEATTIRAVATEAGIDASMVMRYYGSKAGLFSAAIDLDLKLSDAAAGSSVDELGATLAQHFIARWEGWRSDTRSDEVILLLLRSASTNPIAAEQLRTIFQAQVLRVIGDALGNGPDTTRRAGMVVTQVLGVALCRYVLELPPLGALSGSELVAMLTPVLQHYLTGNLEESLATSS